MNTSERFNNVIHVCEDCIEERRKTVQSMLEFHLEQIEEKIMVGLAAFVKVGFPTPTPEKEYMWIRVVKVDREKQNVEGILDNVPVSATTYKHGDYVTMPFSELIQVL